MPSYSGKHCVMATKHAKQKPVSAVFENRLGLKVFRADVDTDQLGTFTGEIERQFSAKDAAYAKCELGLQWAAKNAVKAPFAVSSEASFVSHPHIPWVAMAQEILCFVDRLHGFCLYEIENSVQTNFCGQQIESVDELMRFAERARFPDHALIVRGNGWIEKGITTYESLQREYERARNSLMGAPVMVETDMRAHMNPTRMGRIKQLAETLAMRLLQHCPKCECPGWGKVGVELGLPCGVCGCETECIGSIVLGCPKCLHKEIEPVSGCADPQYCSFCNP